MYQSPFYPDNYYHVYNRGSNWQTVFFEPKNYHFFLARLKRHIAPNADIFILSTAKSFSFVDQTQTNFPDEKLDEHATVAMEPLPIPESALPSFWQSDQFIHQVGP